MFELTFQVTKFTIQALKLYEVPAENRNYVIAKFVFSPEWAGLEHKAIFEAPFGAYQVPLYNDQCIIPAEVMMTPGTVRVGCIAGEMAVSFATTFKVVPSIYTMTTHYIENPIEGYALFVRDTDTGKECYDNGEWKNLAELLS